jgi:arginyl-tRNA synthetase
VSAREKDVDFDWEDVLATDGDTGPYVQYGHARCSSVLGKAGAVDIAALAGADPAPLSSDLEWAVARVLSDLPDVVARAAQADEPHVVARYLLDLCATYSRWYTAGNADPAARVLSDDPATRTARLALVAATRSVLAFGLQLLGLEAPDSM